MTSQSLSRCEQCRPGCSSIPVRGVFAIATCKNGASLQHGQREYTSIGHDTTIVLCPCPNPCLLCFFLLK